MFKSCEDCKNEKGCKFKEQYKQQFKTVEEQQNKFNKEDTPFIAKVYCKEFFAKPCRFEYECEWCGFVD